MIEEDVLVKPATVESPEVHSDFIVDLLPDLLIRPMDPTADMRAKMNTITNVLIKKPSGLSGGGRKQGTQGLYKGIEFDSKWEYAYYRWATEIKHMVVQRNTTEFFYYMTSDNKKQKFYPDFKVNGRFVEIKGRYRPNDVLKKESTYGSVEFIGPTEIKPIIKELRERIPNWQEDYVAHTHKTKLGKPSLFF